MVPKSKELRPVVYSQGKNENRHFSFQKNGKYQRDPLSVYTHTPELLYGVSHIVLSDTHRFNDPHYHKQQLDWHITLLTLEAEHPITKVTIPIVVSNSREFTEGTDSALG